MNLEIRYPTNMVMLRWCLRGSIDRWIDLYESRSEGKLSNLVKRFCPHIGQESFFELM